MLEVDIGLEEDTVAGIVVVGAVGIVAQVVDTAVVEAVGIAAQVVDIAAEQVVDIVAAQVAVLVVGTAVECIALVIE